MAGYFTTPGNVSDTLKQLGITSDPSLTSALNALLSDLGSATINVTTTPDSTIILPANSIQVLDTTSATVQGSNGSVVITGPAGQDGTFKIEGGSDTIYSLSSRTYNSESANKIVVKGSDNYIVGGGGQDTILASGNSTVQGTMGDTKIVVNHATAGGGEGHDTIIGGGGSHLVGTGNDTIITTSGNNLVEETHGGDLIQLQSNGSDTVFALARSTIIASGQNLNSPVGTQVFAGESDSIQGSDGTKLDVFLTARAHHETVFGTTGGETTLHLNGLNSSEASIGTDTAGNTTVTWGAAGDVHSVTVHNVAIQFANETLNK